MTATIIIVLAGWSLVALGLGLAIGPLLARGDPADFCTTSPERRPAA